LGIFVLKKLHTPVQAHPVILLKTLVQWSQQLVQQILFNLIGVLMDVMLVLSDINAKIQGHPYLLFVQLDFIGQQLEVIFVYNVH